MYLKCRYRPLPLDCWPAAARMAWERATRRGDVLEPSGLLASLRPASLHSYRDNYGLWLTFLMEENALDPENSGAEHLNATQVRAFIAVLSERLAPLTVVQRLECLACVVEGMFEDASIEVLKRAAVALNRTARPVRAKRERILHSRSLLDLGLDLMAGSESQPDPIKAAKVYRDGLMIALLALRPLRASNFVGIEIGRHLITRNDGLWLTIPDEEVKNHQAIEFRFPENLLSHLDMYMVQHRPTLVGGNPDNAFLWPGQNGIGHLSKSQLRMNVTKYTRKRFGIAINTHLFRDCAATSIAIDDPGHVHTIVRILGHSTLATSERYYNQATSIEAARRMQSTLFRYRQR